MEIVLQIIRYLCVNLALLARFGRRLSGTEKQSTCSAYATQRGAGQRVVTYSYFTPGGRTLRSQSSLL